MRRWATFDCYGTLIDWNGGIGRELERLFGPNEAGEKLRGYHELEPEIQREDPSRSYSEVMAIALARLGAPADEHDALARSLPGWEPFPEVTAALDEARSRGWSLAILSNSDRDLIDASAARLGVPFEETIVASEIGSYKPAFMHWLEFQARTRADRRRQVHVGASNYHDIVPASKLRIPNVWINRDDEAALTAPTVERDDLVDLADILDQLIPA